MVRSSSLLAMILQPRKYEYENMAHIDVISVLLRFAWLFSCCLSYVFITIVNHMAVSFDNHNSFHTDKNLFVDDANLLFCDPATNFSTYNTMNLPYLYLTVVVDCAGDNPEVVCDCCDCKWSG